MLGTCEMLELLSILHGRHSQWKLRTRSYLEGASKLVGNMKSRNGGFSRCLFSKHVKCYGPIEPSFDQLGHALYVKVAFFFETVQILNNSMLMKPF